MTDFAALRERMIERHIEGRGLDDPALVAAFRSVPREAFVSRDYAEAAYADTPLPIGNGQTISQPYIVALTIDAAEIAPERPRLLMSPRGRPLTQSRVEELAAGPGPLIVCGRFEGVDQRVIEARRLEEVSIGDYVLSGGEIAAMALIDACVRLLPGVMGKLASGADESFSDFLLEYPQYTRPQDFEGRSIPDILLSGDHARVAAWRRAEAEALTRNRRPDLWQAHAKQTGNQKAPKSTTDG